jgi:crossover junction endodeoxyribonuclease RuvC
MRTILGIDPGLNITGYGVIDVASGRVRLLEAGVVRSRRDAELAHKVKEIYDGVREVIEMFSPEVMAMEELYTHYDRPTTAVRMGHARGCICLAAAQSGIEVLSYESTKVKKLLTGSGRATKDQVQRAIKLELGLASNPEPPDVADAIALAFCHFYHERMGASNFSGAITDAIKGNFPDNTVLR